MVPPQIIGGPLMSPVEGSDQACLEDAGPDHAERPGLLEAVGDGILEPRGVTLPLKELMVVTPASEGSRLLNVVETVFRDFLDD
jgi:hypothetical protein